MKIEDVKIEDEDVRVMMESGLVLREAGRLDEAEKVFAGLKEIIPDSEVPPVVLSSIAARRGNLDEALRLCDEAVRQNPESLYARVNRAEILLYRKERKEAETELNEILDKSPDSPHGKTAKALLDVVKMIDEDASVKTV